MLHFLWSEQDVFRIRRYEELALKDDRRYFSVVFLPNGGVGITDSVWTQSLASGLCLWWSGIEPPPIEQAVPANMLYKKSSEAVNSAPLNILWLYVWPGLRDAVSWDMSAKTSYLQVCAASFKTFFYQL